MSHSKRDTSCQYVMFSIFSKTSIQGSIQKGLDIYGMTPEGEFYKHSNFFTAFVENLTFLSSGKMPPGHHQSLFCGLDHRPWQAIPAATLNKLPASGLFSQRAENTIGLDNSGYLLLSYCLQSAGLLV